MQTIFDSHLDLAWAALFYDRDLTETVETLRAGERIEQRFVDQSPTVSLSEMRGGGVRLCVGTIFARCRRREVQAEAASRIAEHDYSSPAQAFAAAQGQLAYYQQLERQDELRLLTSANELLEHAATHDDARIGCLLMIEGADPIVAPDQLGLWHEQGVRIVSLVHTGRNVYAVGNGDDGPITDAGKRLLDAMRERRMILDVSHLSDQSFRDAMEHFDGSVVATHSNCRHFVPGNRQLDDEQIRALVERDSVIGVVAFNSFLDARWKMKQPNQTPVGLARMVDHIDHICQIAGGPRHVGIGSDLDGGFGRQDSPAELDTIAGLMTLADLLAQRGYDRDDVAAILRGNWLRVYSEAME